MYSESIIFKFKEGITESEKMELLRSMFLESEAKNIDPICYSGYKISQASGIEFSSSCPGLTDIILVWLRSKMASNVITVIKPKHI